MIDLKSVLDLVDRFRGRELLPLCPRHVWNLKLAREIEQLKAVEIGVTRSQKLDALKAGLHLWNDDLERSHDLAQDLHDNTGSYWHGLMHRREPDYGNARYWLRRAGDHPAHPIVQHRARALAQQSPEHPVAQQILSRACWDPLGFVDHCEKRDDAFMQAVNQAEVEALVSHCLESLS